MESFFAPAPENRLIIEHRLTEVHEFIKFVTDAAHQGHDHDFEAYCYVSHDLMSVINEIDEHMSTTVTSTTLPQDCWFSKMKARVTEVVQRWDDDGISAQEQQWNRAFQEVLDLVLYTFDLPREVDGEMIYEIVLDPGDMRHVVRENSEWTSLMYYCIGNMVNNHIADNFLSSYRTGRASLRHQYELAGATYPHLSVTQNRSLDIFHDLKQYFELRRARITTMNRRTHQSKKCVMSLESLMESSDEATGSFPSPMESSESVQGSTAWFVSRWNKLKTREKIAFREHIGQMLNVHTRWDFDVDILEGSNQVVIFYIPSLLNALAVQTFNRSDSGNAHSQALKFLHNPDREYRAFTEKAYDLPDNAYIPERTHYAPYVPERTHYAPYVPKRTYGRRYVNSRLRLSSLLTRLRNMDKLVSYE
jgi:hypothetical protein